MIQHTLPKLAPGDALCRDEFLRRWEAMPGLKRAELIQGVVQMPSPVSADHGRSCHVVGVWLGHYQARTPGLDGGQSTTWLMLDDAPQPDVHLRVLPEYGGQSGQAGPYPQGAPELAVEISLTTAALDLGAKLELYQRAGVREYIVVSPRDREIRWHALTPAGYALLPADADGLHRSRVFPGLWLDGAALLNGDLQRVLAVVEQGLASPEHAAFVEELRKRRAL